ncbi:24204_t:CDS:1, partial [Gigaspora rosea]
AVSNILNGKNVNKTIVKFTPKYKKWAYTPQGLREIAKAMKSKILNPLYNMKRYWKPIIIYIYGNPGTAKSEICKDLFPGIYEKADNE